MRRYLYGILILFAIGISLFTYFELNKSKNIEDALRKANVPFNSILLSTDYKSRTITFYEYQGKVSFGILQNGVMGWKWVEGGSTIDVEGEHEISWHITNRLIKPANKNSIYLFWGIVHNSDIETVQLELGSGEKVISNLSRAGKISIVYWLFDKMEDENPLPNIFGFSKEGKKIFQYR